MPQRSPRWKKPPPKILSTPASTRIVHCYAIEGAAYIFSPLIGEVAEVILINDAREIQTVRSLGEMFVSYPTEQPMPGWRVLGWRPLNGAARHGPFDAVDPDMADLEKLTAPNRAIAQSHSTAGHYSPPR